MNEIFKKSPNQTLNNLKMTTRTFHFNVLFLFVVDFEKKNSLLYLVGAVEISSSHHSFNDHLFLILLIRDCQNF